MKKFILLLAVAFAMLANVNLKANVPPIEPTDTDSNGIKNVSTLNHLQWIITYFNSCYRDSFELDNNIDASSTINWNNGEGFFPIGLGSTNRFEGKFYGKNHSINNFYIHRTSTDYIGFISSSIGKIKDLAITNCNIVGSNDVGALVGSNDGVIENCNSSGYVEGYNSGYNIGGLVGYNTELVTSSISSAEVSGGYNVGGLIGNNYIIDLTTKLVYGCYSSGSVKGLNYVGGLIGINHGSGFDGMVIGEIAYVNNCYSVSNVFGNNYVGGFVGAAVDRSNISNSYAMGRVQSNSSYQGVGGFAGYVNNRSYIDKCYSQGRVNPISQNVGGFVGMIDDRFKVTNCYWDNVISGQSTSAAGLSATQTNMWLSSTYSNWDFVNTWNIGPNDNGKYPFLRNVAVVNNVLEPFDTDGDSTRNIVDLRYLRWVSEYYELGWSWNYELDNDIDASITNSWNWGDGFSPIGNYTKMFSGEFQGNSHVISGLHINRPNQSYIGLFGCIGRGSYFFNLQLTNCDIKGYDHVGGISGKVYNTIVNGSQMLITFERCITTGVITGYENVGGLFGDIELNNTDLSGTYVSKSCSKCYVTGISFIGGLIGSNQGWINNCYSRGTVSGTNFIGGGFGSNSGNGLIDKCFSTGIVNSSNTATGLIEINSQNGQVTNSYWDMSTSGKLTSGGGTGKYTFEMINPNTFIGWDFTTIWECIANENNNYPSFRGVPNYKMNSDYNEFNITSENIKLNISPNPIATEATVTIDSYQDIFANIYIYNTLGQIMKSCYSGNISKGTKEITLNLQDLVEGSYYLIIENNGVLSCKMIVISR